MLWVNMGYSFSASVGNSLRTSSVKKYIEDGRLDFCINRWGMFKICTDCPDRGRCRETDCYPCIYTHGSCGCKQAKAPPAWRSTMNAMCGILRAMRVSVTIHNVAKAFGIIAAWGVAGTVKTYASKTFIGRIDRRTKSLQARMSAELMIKAGYASGGKTTRVGGWDIDRAALQAYRRVARTASFTRSATVQGRAAGQRGTSTQDSASVRVSIVSKGEGTRTSSSGGGAAQMGGSNQDPIRTGVSIDSTSSLSSRFFASAPPFLRDLRRRAVAVLPHAIMATQAAVEERAEGGSNGTTSLPAAVQGSVREQAAGLVLYVSGRIFRDVMGTLVQQRVGLDTTKGQASSVRTQSVSTPGYEGQKARKMHIETTIVENEEWEKLEKARIEWTLDNLWKGSWNGSEADSEDALRQFYLDYYESNNTSPEQIAADAIRKPLAVNS